MMDAAAMCDLFERYLVLSEVTPDTTVGVVSQGSTRAEYADACLAACRRIGANGIHVRVPEPAATGAWEVGRTGLSGNAAAVEMLAQCELVIDLVFMLFSREQFAIQARGTRIATVVEPVDLLARLFPTVALRDEVERAAERLALAETLRITSPAGTDVTYQLGAYPTISEYGYTTDPGRWDHWPAAFVFSGAHDDGVDGKIVIAPGDVLLPFNSYAHTAIELTVTEGFITAIDGDLDAQLIRAYIDSFDDPRGYGMSHVGWGLDPRAHWHGLTQFPGGMGMELRSFRGNVMFSIGPNNELGGPNDTPCHLDIPMRGCSLELDGVPVVRDGHPIR